jgi:hypothetical protein
MKVANLTLRIIFTLHLSDFYLRNVKIAGELLRLSLLPGSHRNNPEFLFSLIKIQPWLYFNEGL